MHAQVDAIYNDIVTAYNSSEAESLHAC